MKKALHRYHLAQWIKSPWQCLHF